MPKILLVDDSPVERRLIGGILERSYEIEAAEDGLDALEKIKAALPDVVLTDLQMPELDGLELVRHIKIHHADLPVVLMTAHGSEDIALQALRAGAATYVPKEQLAESLHDSISQVLSIAAAGRSSLELKECLNESHLEFELDSDPALIEPLVRLVQGDIRALGFDGDSPRVQLGVALEQALLNALYRGNLEITADEIDAARERQMLGEDVDPVQQRRSESLYNERRIFVDVALSRDEVRFVVRDEGPGFDVASLAQPNPDAMTQGQGRGILLMNTFMDDVQYNDTGNEVTLVKRAAQTVTGTT